MKKTAELKFDGEPMCIKCGKVEGSFIPICDYHDKNPNQTGSMDCADCQTCDNCLPRQYWSEVFNDKN